MSENTWPGHSVERASYRAVLQRDIPEEKMEEAFGACQAGMEVLKEGKVLLTASLYRHDRFLFLYAEGAGRAIDPEEICGALKPLLQPWPAMPEKPEEDRLWVYMQPYFYHAVPTNAGEWMQDRHPARRCGRIALLAPGKWEEYMQYHLLLMREGIISGDRYHLISLHENVLFSYFEAPKTVSSLQKKKDAKSQVLEEWIGTDPESHFIRFVTGQGPDSEHNFLFLPCCAGV